MVVHAAHERVDVVRDAAGECAVAVDDGIADVQTNRAVGAVVVVQRNFDLVGRADLLGFGVEQVQGAGPGVRRPVLQRRHHAVAFGFAGAPQGLDAVRVVRSRRHAWTPVIPQRLPGLVQAHLVFLDRRAGVRIADRKAEPAIGRLRDVAGVDALAVGGRVGGLAQRVALATHAEGADRLAEVERAHGLQVERAGQALADEPRVRGLVDGDAADQLGRVLVELDAAVVARADHLATIEQRGGEVGRQPAHADHLCTTGDTLRGQARQARERFGDADIRKLADVFGRDGLDDGGGLALHRDGALDATADADDGYLVQVGRCNVGRLVIVLAVLLRIRGCSRSRVFLPGGLVFGGLCLHRRAAQQHRGCQRNAQYIAIELQHFPSQSMSTCLRVGPGGPPSGLVRPGASTAEFR